MSDLDVVVVAYRSRDVIEEAVLRATSLPEVASVVVVDNGDDGSGDVAEQAGATVLRRSDNPGFGAGQNLGVAIGSAPFVLLLNPDASMTVEGLREGLRVLRSWPAVAAVQGKIVNRASGGLERSHGDELGPAHLLGRALGARRLLRLGPVRAIAARTRFRDHVQRQVESAAEVESLAATAMLIRRFAFEQVGGFDEHFFLYGEDLDLCRRLRSAGWKLMALPDQFAVHVSGASSAGTWERELWWWQGTMRFGAKWWTRPQRIGAIFASVLRWTTLAARRPREARRAWEAVVAPGFSPPRALR